MTKIALTGIKPTGDIHLGNYLGAIRPGIEMGEQDDTRCFYFVADYHALNGQPPAVQLRQNVYATASSWLAFGLDPEKHCLYRQSDVPEIFQVAWILANFTSKGLLNRAHSYKDKVAKNQQGRKDPDWGINAGLYNYPVLMASDILSFAADQVPVGQDQMQHLEMARDIAQDINSHYQRDVLKLPQASIKKEMGVIPGLDGQKMSKSYQNTLPLFVPEKRLKKLINKIPTDSSPAQEPKDPANSVIFQLYSFIAPEEKQKQLRQRYQEGISWGEAKQNLFEDLDALLQKPRSRYNELMASPQKVDQILQEGAQKVRPRAQKVLASLQEVTGLR